MLGWYIPAVPPLVLNKGCMRIVPQPAASTIERERESSATELCRASECCASCFDCADCWASEPMARPEPVPPKLQKLHNNGIRCLSKGSIFHIHFYKHAYVLTYIWGNQILNYWRSFKYLSMVITSRTSVNRFMVKQVRQIQTKLPTHRHSLPRACTASIQWTLSVYERRNKSSNILKIFLSIIICCYMPHFFCTKILIR